MKNFVAILFTLTFHLSCSGQQQKIRLIVRGDDMGYTHSGNQALIECYRNGIQKTIEVIVPSPWFPEAVKMLRDNPGVDVGVHLAITSEWDNLKWRPLTDCPSLEDEDGYFFPFTRPNASYPGRSLQERKFLIADIEKEFRAQIEMALEKIPQVSHISGHMGCTDLTDEVKALSKRLAREYKIDIDLVEHQVKYVSYDGAHRTFEEKKISFSKMLDQLSTGTYLFVDHPGLNTPELQAVNHVGYEHVAEDRQGVASLWTDPEIKKKIREKGIELIAYRDLIR
jgi:chitin disaccharide deacetylase